MKKLYLFAYNFQRFSEFGENLGLSNRQIEGVFNRLVRNKKLATSLLEASFLSNENKKKYTMILNDRYNRI